MRRNPKSFIQFARDRRIWVTNPPQTTGIPFCMLIRLMIFLTCILCGTASAQGNGPHKALADPASAKAWTAVGRLDIDNRGFCTGALIADQLVLTAAHCLYNKGRPGLVDAQDIVFKAGLRNGRAAATRRAARFIIHPDYINNSTEKVKNVPFDIAVVELERPIRTADIVPFEVNRKPGLDDSVMVVSYARGRSGFPSLEDGCKMFDIHQGALVYTCDVDFGASGSPVFVLTSAGPKIASVMTSKSLLRDKKVALGAPLGSALDRLLNRLAQSNPQSKFVAAGRKPIGAQLDRRNRKSSRLPQITR